MQGFNMGRYHPPALLDANLPTFNRAGAPISPTIRFELPFAIWCTTCTPESLIAQGVRFNAYKKKVGNYFSTPIWSFRFKHTVCGGWVEVRTDPERTEYIVFEGGRRRDYGVQRDWWEEESGQDGKEAEVEADGAFGGMERKRVDADLKSSRDRRVEELQKRSLRDWADPYEKNRRVRREFRVGRRRRQDDERSAKALGEKFGLGVDVLPQTDEDGKKATLVEYGTVREERSAEVGIFDPRSEGMHKARSSGRSEGAKVALRKSLRGSTRAVADPFLKDGRRRDPIVRHRPKLEDIGGGAGAGNEHDVTTKPALVGYDSD